MLDTRKMDRHTRGELLESLAEEDTGSNLVILQKLRARMDKAGIQPPVVVVRYQNLSVLTTIIVGDQSVPTLTNFVKRMTGVGDGAPRGGWACERVCVVCVGL